MELLKQASVKPGVDLRNRNFHELNSPIPRSIKLSKMMTYMMQKAKQLSITVTIK